MAFETLTSASGVVWRRSSLLRQAGIPHAFSTRCGGVSQAPFASLNLGLAEAPGEPDSWENVRGNWDRLLQACGLHGRTLVRARQVHGVGVLQPDIDVGAVRATPPFADGDAIVSGDPGHAVAVRIADCAPVLIADPDSRLVAAVHAGWRGVVGGVVTAALAGMAIRGPGLSRPLVAIGPCIGPRAFEVGSDVRDAFANARLADFVRPRPGVPGKWLADLRAAILRQLVEAGVPGECVDVCETCTVECDATEFSYRREGPRSGRMAAVIGL